MSGSERREQLLAVGRATFAERGYEGTTIEEIAARAEVSKPVVYGHFGGKEGLYAAVVDREVAALLDSTIASLDAHRPKALLEQGVLGLLRYIESNTEGFRILARDSGGGAGGGTAAGGWSGAGGGRFAHLLNDVVGRLEPIVAEMFDKRGYPGDLAPIYSQALVGMVASTGLWWLDARKPALEVVASHLVNLAWTGLAGMGLEPPLGD